MADTFAAVGPPCGAYAMGDTRTGFAVAPLAYVSSMHLADSMQSRPQQLSMLALLALFYNAVLTAFFAVLELLTLSGCFAPTGALRRCCCTAANDSTRLGIAAVLLLWTGAVEVATRSDMGAVVGCAGMLCALPHVLLAAGAD